MELSVLFEECHCNCHRDNMVAHVMPCCQPCRYCGRNIKVVSLELHERRCREKRKDLVQGGPANSLVTVLKK